MAKAAAVKNGAWRRRRRAVSENSAAAAFSWRLAGGEKQKKPLTSKKATGVWKSICQSQLMASRRIYVAS